jgi:hypothetical protein
VYFHRSEHAGDHPRLPEVLSVLKGELHGS